MSSPRARERRTWRWRVWAGLGVIVAIGLGAWSLDALRAGRHARATRRSVVERRFVEAEATLARWLRARPESAEAHYWRARVALARGRPQEALDASNRARDLGHDAIAAERIRAVLLARAGRHAEAEPVLRRAFDEGAEPGLEIAEAMARVALETYRLGLAAEALQRWRRLAPQDPTPYLWQAEVDARTREDRPDLLITDYREALRRDPDLAKARLGLADSLARAGRHQEAAEEFARYLARRPDDPVGHVGAGDNALERGDDVAAAGHFDRALQLDPNQLLALLGRATIALRRDQPTDALRWLDRAKAIDPHEPKVRFQRGLALSRLGRADEARAEQEAAAGLRRDAERLAEIRDGLVRSPRDLTLQVEAARWLLDHGHDQEGLSWAKKVLGDQPGHPELNRLLAAYYERKGDVGLANYHRVQAGVPP